MSCWMDEKEFRCIAQSNLCYFEPKLAKRQETHRERFDYAFKLVGAYNMNEKKHCSQLQRTGDEIYEERHKYSHTHTPESHMVPCTHARTHAPFDVQIAFSWSVEH